MNRQINQRTFMLLVLVIIAAEITGQTDGYNKIRWEKEKIAPGLVWKSSHTILYDSVPQNINILFVNLKKRNIFINYDPQKNIPVSKQASEAHAIAAVNGGFFNIKYGGSTTYVRTNGRIVNTDTAIKWSRNSNMTGSLLIIDGKKLFIERSKANTWYDNHPDYDDILVTGPLLVEKYNMIKLPETPLVTNRHPRTAIGIRNNRKVLLITLDGRTREAAGMTLNELAAFMASLKCRDAVNLDGGGSTTMWIDGKAFNGVVNMPCDNKKFDHLGERAVSNILIIR